MVASGVRLSGVAGTAVRMGERGFFGRIGNKARVVMFTLASALTALTPTGCSPILECSMRYSQYSLEELSKLKVTKELLKLEREAKTPQQLAVLAARQLYDKIIDEEGYLTLPPILRRQTFMRGSCGEIAHQVLALYGKYPNGKVPVKKLWDVLRFGMRSPDSYLTHMTYEALVDMFGGRTVSLRDAVIALRNARLKFAFQPDLYNFNSYRKGTKFVAPKQIKIFDSDSYSVLICPRE